MCRFQEIAGRLESVLMTSNPLSMSQLCDNTDKYCFVIMQHLGHFDSVLKGENITLDSVCVWVGVCVCGCLCGWVDVCEWW